MKPQTLKEALIQPLLDRRELKSPLTRSERAFSDVTALFGFCPHILFYLILSVFKYESLLCLLMDAIEFQLLQKAHL